MNSFPGTASGGIGSTHGSERGVYPISVVVELTGISAQTLRLYERRGVLTPARTDGGTRRYSSDDLLRLGRITALLADGINLAGIAAILELQDHNQELRASNADLANDNRQLTDANAGLRDAAGEKAEPTPHRR